MIDHKKHFGKLLREIDYSKNDYDIFRDFLALSSLSLSNSIIKCEEREKEYLKIAARYEKNHNKFAHLFGIVIDALDKDPFQDFLGDLYMSLEFGNKHTGQFFTPYHLSLVVAQCAYDDSLKETIDKQGYITVNEPASGSGGMLIAFAQVLKEKGFNPQEVMHFVATDVDEKCFQMCYIQTSLLGLKGIAEWGNTLTVKTYKAYKTPMALLFGKINKTEKIDKADEKPQQIQERKQLTLF